MTIIACSLLTYILLSSNLTFFKIDVKLQGFQLCLPTGKVIVYEQLSDTFPIRYSFLSVP